jgi:anthranilate synthase/phosphoribosyltransferase
MMDNRKKAIMATKKRKVLFIDNFDSFTYNLVDDFCKRDCEARVYRADTPLAELQAVAAQFQPDLLVISPGPGTPSTAGVTLEAIGYFKDKLPILGVCLGHQAIAQYFGGEVGHAAQPMHGKASRVTHNNKGIFVGVDNPMQAGRYHSLCVTRMPECLEITAEFEGVAMALRHISLPIFGVQFHPESILTPCGGRIIDNVLKLAAEYTAANKARQTISITEYIEPVLRKEDLPQEKARQVMDAIFEFNVAEAQIAAMLTALRVKGATAAEIAGFAQSLKSHAVKVKPRSTDLVDTCGTGGGAVKTFNISTAAALVAAGAGVKVAKHGNRGITSKCGSADVLETLGVKIDAAPTVVAKCIDEAGIGFMFAPMFHPAMKYVQPTRKSLGFRTLFNILGPLANPANAKAQVMGVADESLMDTVAEALLLLGSKYAIVVHSSGLDEISLAAATRTIVVKDGTMTRGVINPGDFGMSLCTIDELKGLDAATNAQTIRDILSGKVKGPKKDIVVLNAAAAIIAGGRAGGYGPAIEMARESIDSGRAAGCLDKLIVISRG